MSSASPTTSKGYGVADTKNYQNFTVQEYKLKTADAHDVTLDIECCGVCGSEWVF